MSQIDDATLHAPSLPQRDILPEAVRPATLVVVSGLIVAGLATVAALAGLFWPAEADIDTVSSVHGESIELYGEGLYRYDSVFKGAGIRGADLVTIVLAIPVLLWALLRYRRRSLRAALTASAARILQAVDPLSPQSAAT